jgi:hypothetical protein
MKHIYTILILLLFFMVSISTGQIKWTKYDNNPVMGLGVSGSWNDVSYGPSNVVLIGSTYHTWLAGFDGEHFRIGYFTSYDGINWTEYAGNPVLNIDSNGSWDSNHVYRVYVLYEDTTYHMWYTGISDLGISAIGYATSSDGIKWTKYSGNPVMENGPTGSWDDDHVMSPCVISDGITYHMWYEGVNGSNYHIGYATSSDKITWTKHPTPVLSGDVDQWDYPRIEGPAVYFDGTIYHMWYSGGSNLFHWQIGYASSPDGLVWTKFNENPVLKKGNIGDWDDQTAGFGTVIFDTVNNIYKMWYGGAREDWSDILGYATAPIIDALEEIDSRQFPDGFVLNQNYPNPFNPSTTIEFNVPKSEFVELKVYNILGKEITTLVSKKLNQGNHTYTFNRKNLASGIYYYQLVAGEYREVKKMILIK